jgi:hypothetical protein
MRTDALFQRYELFASSAVIAAHANAPDEGFRQRDVRFLIELLSNWVDYTLDGAVLELKNTQVARYLDNLVEEGAAKRTTRGKRPRYRLTRIGFLELLSRLTTIPANIEPAHFLYIFYFLSNYRQRLLDLIQREGDRFPVAMQLEVEDLLDTKALVEEERKRISIELKKLHSRIADSKQSSRLARDLYRRGLSGPEVAQKIEETYPYALNSQKPLSELYSEIPKDIGQWELEEGTLQRCEQLWNPSRVVLNAYMQQLNKLL